MAMGCVGAAVVSEITGIGVVVAGTTATEDVTGSLWPGGGGGGGITPLGVDEGAA